MASEVAITGVLCKRLASFTRPFAMDRRTMGLLRVCLALVILADWTCPGFVPAT